MHLFVYRDSYAAKDIVARLASIGAAPGLIQRIEKNMEADNLNTGFTYSSTGLRQSVVVIGRTSSGPEFLNSFCHEFRHLCDDIAAADGLSLSGEPVAYLAGDMCNYVADIVCKMACDHCRES